MHYGIIRGVKATKGERRAKRKENTTMATLANFYGILIGMKPEKNGKHHRAHIHAWYSGKVAVFDILTRKRIKGSLPPDQTNMVKAFIAIHEAELLANWESIHLPDGKYFPIDK